MATGKWFLGVSPGAVKDDLGVPSAENTLFEGFHSDLTALSMHRAVVGPRSTIGSAYRARDPPTELYSSPIALS